MTRWRVVLDLDGEFGDAHAARMQAFLLYGRHVDRVVSRVSDEIAESERRMARRDRTRPPKFVDSDALAEELEEEP